jgi:hypothetical protein
MSVGAFQMSQQYWAFHHYLYARFACLVVLASARPSVRPSVYPLLPFSPPPLPPFSCYCN